MSRVLLSCLGGFLGVTLGLGTSALFGEIRNLVRPHAPEVVSRTYKTGPSGWITDGGGGTKGGETGFVGSSYGEQYTCSDGTVLTYVRVEYDSPPSAARELQRRVVGIDGTPRTWPALQNIPCRFGHLVQFESPIAIEHDPNHGVARWVFIDVFGRNLVMVYGPTKEHIIELLDANPGNQW